MSYLGQSARFEYDNRADGMGLSMSESVFCGTKKRVSVLTCIHVIFGMFLLPASTQ